MHQVSVKNINIGVNKRFVLIAGPCVIESEGLILDTAKRIKDIRKTKDSLYI